MCDLRKLSLLLSLLRLTLVMLEKRPEGGQGASLFLAACRVGPGGRPGAAQTEWGAEGMQVVEERGTGGGEDLFSGYIPGWRSH